MEKEIFVNEAMTREKMVDLVEKLIKSLNQTSESGVWLKLEEFVPTWYEKLAPEAVARDLPLELLVRFHKAADTGGFRAVKAMELIHDYLEADDLHISDWGAILEMASKLNKYWEDVFNSPGEDIKETKEDPYW
jgi:hypothetical protein